ncbi:hypothetical protein [Kaistella sp.]
MGLRTGAILTGGWLIGGPVGGFIGAGVAATINVFKAIRQAKEEDEEEELLSKKNTRSQHNGEEIN